MRTRARVSAKAGTVFGYQEALQNKFGAGNGWGRPLALDIPS